MTNKVKNSVENCRMRSEILCSGYREERKNEREEKMEMEEEEKEGIREEEEEVEKEDKEGTKVVPKIISQSQSKS